MRPIDYRTKEKVHILSSASFLCIYVGHRSGRHRPSNREFGCSMVTVTEPKKIFFYLFSLWVIYPSNFYENRCNSIAYDVHKTHVVCICAKKEMRTFNALPPWQIKYNVCKCSLFIYIYITCPCAVEYYVIIIIR